MHAGFGAEFVSVLADIINNSITEIGIVSIRKLEKLIKKIKYINFTYNIKYDILN